MNGYEVKYRKAINDYLECGENNVFFYWKGRVALFAILQAMGIGYGDEVIIQGYTCVVVANAVLYLNALPVYADIDPDTYNINLDSLKSRITANTKAIICQNTYGLSSNLERIASIADETAKKYGHAVYTIEDCTHGFGGMYHGKPNGTSCDASFFSTQWSKPYSTGVGGFCVVHNEDIKKRIADLNKSLIRPGVKEKLELKLMYFVRSCIINDHTYWPMIRLYRWMSSHNLVLGSSSGEEVSGTELPKSFFKAQSPVQFKKGLKSIKHLEEVNRLRRSNAELYTEFLAVRNKVHVSKDLFNDHVFIRYPLLVNDRERFRQEAEKERIILGEWFESPVYPSYAPLSVWKVKEEEIPISMYVCRHVVNLSTEVRDPRKVISFLAEHIDMIVSVGEYSEGVSG